MIVLFTLFSALSAYLAFTADTTTSAALWGTSAGVWLVNAFMEARR